MPKQYFNIRLGAKPALVEAQNFLRRKLPQGVNYTDPATFHITLLVVEDANGASLAELPAVNDLPTFGAIPSWIDYFDTPNGYAVYLAIQRNASLTYLQTSLYLKAIAAGAKIAANTYPQAYRPHITMGYADNRPEDMFGYDTENASFEVMGYELTNEGETEPVAQWSLLNEVLVQEQQGNSNRLEVSEQVSTTQGRSQINLVCISEMAGKYPDIKLPSDVNIAEMKKRHPERRFVTLPVGQFNAKSRNERRYLESAMRQMAEQINIQRPEGGWGHIKSEDAGTAYAPPAIHWLAAEIHGNTVWAKGWPGTQESENYFNNARDINARTGTSLYAWADMNEAGDVSEMDLIRLDLADPARVGVPMTAAMPQLTTEMHDQERVPEQPTEPVHEEPVMSTEITELTLKVSEQKRLLDEMEKQIKELKAFREDVEDVRELLAIGESVDFVKAVRELKDSYEEYATENAQLLESNIEAEVKDKVVVEQLRPMVQMLIEGEKPRTRKDLTRAVDKVMALEQVKKALAGAVIAESGPPQGAPVTPNTTGNTSWDRYLAPKPVQG